MSIYGQEYNHTTWQLAAMNMVIRGIDFDFGKEPASTYTHNQHPDLRADYIMANPPFNMKEWDVGVNDDDPRWKYGTPPSGNANFAWMQHMLYHLSPNGTMGLLLANGSLDATKKNEFSIKKAIIEEDLVECIIALPGKLFTNTDIPACIWFMAKRKCEGKTASGRYLRDRKKEVLFIDARKLGFEVERTVWTFLEEDRTKIVQTFHNWQEGNNFEHVPGFCRSIPIAEIEKHDFVLTPGRYVGVAEQEDDNECFEERMTHLTDQLKAQFKQSDKLKQQIKGTLKDLGYDC